MFLFYPIILILGLSTSYTDIKYRKIKNTHLLLGITFGLTIYVFLIANQQITLNSNLAWNPLIALAIGFLLYYTNTWGAGDAKLFTVYSLLMPTQKYTAIFPFPCFAVFINIFLISSLILLVLSLREIAQNIKTVVKKASSISSFTTQLREFGKSFLIIFSLMWIIQSIKNQFIQKASSFLLILILYFAFKAVSRLIRKLKNNSVLIPLLGLGLISRFLFHPEDFNLSNLISHSKATGGYAILFSALRWIFALNKTNDNATKTIPFAPLMFLGTVLTNTNLIFWVVNIFNMIKQ